MRPMLAVVALALIIAGPAHAAKPVPPPVPPQLVAVAQVMAYGCQSFVGIDTSGRVIVSQCYTGAATVAAQLPSAPVSLHYVPDATLYIGLADGEIYRVDDTRAAPPWSLRFMGNIFTTAGTAARFSDLPTFDASPPTVGDPAPTVDDTQPPVKGGAER